MPAGRGRVSFGNDETHRGGDGRGRRLPIQRVWLSRGAIPGVFRVEQGCSWLVEDLDSGEEKWCGPVTGLTCQKQTAPIFITFYSEGLLE
jgi:hypothetical protein